jgi:nucleotide-binding universal stress UspA family protein
VTVAIASVAALALIAAATLVLRWRNPEKAPHRITPAAKRILFPFVGESVSQSALDAALRLARAEHASLVPAYIATVPMQLKLDAPIPGACSAAMPLLEVIERRAARLEVPVDARIETGRTVRHALRRLADHESFDRMVIPASDSRGGFSAEDIAWVLENVEGEIVVLRPASEAASGHPTRSAAVGSSKVSAVRANASTTS